MTASASTAGTVATTLVASGHVLRLDGSAVPEPTTVHLPWPVSVRARVAPVVPGVVRTGQLQGVVTAESTTAPDVDGRVGWTLGLDRTGRPVARVQRLTTAVAGPEPADVLAEVVGWEPLPRLAWSVVEADLGPDGLALRVDGAVVATGPMPPGLDLTGPCRLALGRAPDAVVEGAVRSGFLTGLLTDVAVGSPDAVADVAATAHVAPAPGPTPAELWRTDPTSHDADRDRPRYHFTPPAQWMNEPHGIVHHDGRHHLFYQRNELGPFWGSITWGHAVSEDLVHWTDLGSALVGADIPYAPDGVWSGSATVDGEGTPLLFFTAGDERDDPNQRTGWAAPADGTDPDLREWRPGPAPVTTWHDAAPALRRQGLEPLPREFRDPFVWHDGDTWFQLVGAGLQGRGGTALLFRSPDPRASAWEFVGPLAVGDAALRPDTGVHWELPVLVPVGEGDDGRQRHAFFVTPWWPEPCEHSLLYAWYWVGTWDGATCRWEPEHEAPRLLDLGGFFTGVTASVAPDGRTLLWTIAQDLLPEVEHAARGWAGNAGLPVEVWYADGDLRVRPVAELAGLRGAPVVDLDATDGAPLPDRVDVDAGPMVELDVLVDLAVDGAVTVDVRGALDQPAARITVTRTAPDAGRVVVLREGSTEPHRRRRSGDVILPAGPVRVRVHLDHSLVEAYVAEHRSVTTRAWARPGDGDGVRVAAGGDARLLRVVAWPLRAAVVDERR